MGDPTGLVKKRTLLEAGADPTDVDAWEQDSRRTLSDAGASVSEIDAYFGKPAFDEAPLKAYFETNLSAWNAERASRAPAVGAPKLELPPGAEGSVPVAPKPDQKLPDVADTFLESLSAGWQMGFLDLAHRGQMPDLALPENAPFHHRLAESVGTFVGDIPAMMAGATVGGPAGFSVAGPPGALVAGGAAAFALPAAMREILVQKYQRGEVDNFADFWDRSSSVFWAASKAAVVGVATAGVGGVAAKTVGRAALPGVVKALAPSVAEIGTMVTVGKGLEGEVPSAEDFLLAAALVGGAKGSIHGGSHVTRKLQTIYVKTGAKPFEVAERAGADPALLAELVSSNVDVPAELGLPEQPVPGRPEMPTVQVDVPASANLGAVGETPTRLTVLKTTEPEARAKPEVKTKPEGEAEVPTEKYQAEIDAFVPDVTEPRLPFEEKATRSFGKLYTNIVDYLHPVKLIQDVVSNGKNVPEKLDAYMKLRNMAGVEEKVQAKISELQPVIEPFLKDEAGLKGFDQYLAAARAREILAQGKEAGLSKEAADHFYAQGKAKYGKAAAELYRVKNEALKALKDSGVLSAESFAKIVDADQNHVPFHRLVSNDGKAPLTKGLANSLKNLKGSDLPINSPLDSSLGNIRLFMQLAERNTAKRAFFDLLDSTPGGEAFSVKEKTKLRPIEDTAPEVKAFFEKNGIEVGSSTDTAEFTIFRPAAKTVGENRVIFFRDGKLQIRTVAPEVAVALNGESALTMNRLMQTMAVTARMLRTGTTLSPEFQVRNVVRDTLSAFLFTPDFIPGVDSAQGAKLSIERGKVFHEWVEGGGANATILAMDKTYFGKDLAALEKETGLLSRAVNVVKTVPEMLRLGTELSENSTRLGVFSRARAAGKSIERSAFESRDLLDFARHGAQTRSWAQITAFLNAHIQGLDKMARVVRDTPEAFSAKVTSGILAPSIYLWWANHDDPRYKAIPNWEKDLFWIFMTKDHIYRIPKPHEVGVMYGSVPERVLEKFAADNPKAFKDLDTTLTQIFLPDVIPNAATPFIELKGGKSLFTGAPLIPLGLEKVLPRDQFTPYTSETGKLIGRAIRGLPGLQDSQASSPILIDHFLKTWTGGLGLHALNLSDMLLTKSGVVSVPPRPLMKLEELPVIKAFMIKYPSARSQRIVDFYDRYTANQKFLNSIKLNAARGDAEAIQRMAELNANPSTWINLTGAATTVGQLNKLVNETYMNRDISPTDKAKIIESAYGAMHAIADNMETAFEELEKETRTR